MIRPATKLTLEVLGGLVAVLALGIIWLAVKLAGGPVSLTFLAPTVASSIETQLKGLDAEVGDVVIEWSQDERALRLKVLDVDVQDAAGTSVASLPELELGLSLPGLRRGLLAPTRVRIAKVALVIERDTEGRFSVGSESAGDAPRPADGPDISADFLARLFARDGFDSAIALAELQISSADITLIDKRTGITIRAPTSRLTFERTEAGLKMVMRATARVADETFDMAIDGDFDTASEKGIVNVGFTPVRLSHVAPLSSFFSAFKSVDFPVSGSAALDLGAGGVITRAELAFEGHPGVFDPGLKGGAPIPVENASLKAAYLPQTGDIELEWLTFTGGGNTAEVSGTLKIVYGEGAPLRAQRIGLDLKAREINVEQPAYFTAPFAIDSVDLTADLLLGATWRADLAGLDVAFGRTRINLAGTVEEGEGSPAIAIEGTVADLDAARLNVLWPINFEEKARDWVTKHVHEGRLTRGQLTIEAPAGAFAAKDEPDNLFVLDFRVEDGKASYVTGLPPLTKAAADMRLTNKTFSLTLDSAQVEGTRLTAGSVLIHALGKKGTPIDITGVGNGRIEEILSIIDNEPLRFITKFGMKPSEIMGDATLSFTITIPQSLDVPPEEIVFTVDATGENVALPTLLEGRPIDKGRVALAGDRGGIKAKGAAHVSGVPFDIAWDERFHNDGPLSSQYRLSARLNDEARIMLGFDTGAMVAGPVDVAVTARGKGKDIASAEGRITLDGAALDLKDIDWRKAAGSRAEIAFDIDGLAGGDINVRTLTISGDGIDVAGSARLAEDQRLIAADFPRLRIDGFSDARFEAGRASDGMLGLNLEGRYFNLGPILKAAMEREGDEEGALAWSLDARLAEAHLREKVSVEDLKAHIVAQPERLKELDVSGRFPGSRDFFASMSETGAGARRLIVGSSDAGRLVAGLTGMRSIEGGRLSINLKLADLPSAQIDPDAAAQRRAGMLRIEDFKVVDLPILARLLTVGSLEGIGDLLQGEGIAFNHLEAPFWLAEDRIGVNDGRAAGSAIGITFQGVIDQEAEKLDLAGSIVPAYTLNSVLGNVPVVGQLLISREGEGVFGFTYAVKGNVDEPLITVNPLAALAPGFLRRIFELGDAEAQRLPPESPAPKAQ